jgi:hypothetical protein
MGEKVGTSRRGAFDRDAATQAGRSRVRFPIVAFEFFISIILPPHYVPVLDSFSNTNEYQGISWGVNAADTWS